MTKKILAALLAVMLLIGLLPVTAFADESYCMDFTARGAQVWAGGQIPETQDASGDGWSWAHESKTLTLSGLNFTTTSHDAIRLPGGAALVLQRGTTNTVRSTYGGDAQDTNESAGIHCMLGSLTVTGGGTLNVTGGTAPYTSVGIRVNGDLIVEGGTVNATGGAILTDGTHYRSLGVWALQAGSVTVSGGTLNATGGTVAGSLNTSCGISVDTTNASALLNLTGGVTVARGQTYALSKAPVLGEGITAAASTNVNGSGAVSYVPADNNSYLYFRSPAPRRASGGSNSGKTTAYSKDDNVKVIVEDGDVTITALEKDSADYTLLLRGQSGEPVMAYEIDGEAIVMFYVGRENAGKEYTVLHKLADGSIEEFHCTCAVNGWITVRVKEFSPFMVFAGSVGGGRAATATAYVDNPDTGANDAVALATAVGTLALIGCCVVGKRRK